MNNNFPSDGNFITVENNVIKAGNKPVIGYIEGDGIGKEIWPAARSVIDSAVKKSYGDERSIAWHELLAGEKAYQLTGEYLPDKTLENIKTLKVAIKGPLTTPVGGGIRSLNVTLRQTLDLYACVRPVRYYYGCPSPVKEPDKVNIVIFRENTEDVYAGIEYKEGSEENKLLREFMTSKLNKTVRSDSGIGIKPISRYGSERIIRRAINFAIENKRNSVTIVHKGNIMKFTEGAFRNWGYELAEREFKDSIITEKELNGKTPPAGKIVLNDRIADAMFQELLLNPANYDVIVTTNLNGDYISDAAAAQVGGLGIAPGANLSDDTGIFEATHGTAPTIAGQDKANPTSIILSAVMMLEHIGWCEPAKLITQAIEKTIKDKKVTCDMQMEGATILKCSEFAEQLVKNL